jgi:PAS domain S-box-containing protein
MNSHDKDKLIAELRESEDRYRSVTETSIDAIITANENDSILTWNNGAEKIFGHGIEIIGDAVSIIIPEKYKKAHQDGVKRFIKTGEKHIIGRTIELEAVHKDGSVFPVELSLSSWNSPSGIRFGGIIRDISERKSIERIREDVERMTRHDLKSPLIGITGLAKVLLKSKNLDSKERKTVALIQELGKKTLKFIARNRDLFQMEQGVYHLESKPVNLMGLFDEIQNELKPLSIKKEVEFKILLFGKSFTKETEYFVMGEEELLQMMFTNLMKNAVEASPEKSSVLISVDDEKENGQRYHTIDIHNLGCIPKDINDKFFAPYVTSGKKEGTGLGTHNARLIAQAHGGDIHFTTSEKKGTHIIVKLPVVAKT